MRMIAIRVFRERFLGGGGGDDIARIAFNVVFFIFSPCN
jgi:hypothetical protein